MVSRIFWIIGVGIPIYYIFYLGLIGVGLEQINYGTLYDFVPEIPIAIGFLFVGLTGIVGTSWQYNIKRMSSKHCELTNFAIVGLIVGLGYVIYNFTQNINSIPFGTYQEWLWLLGITLLAGSVGFMLYRAEKHKWPF